jgi:hypothetical protein
MFSCGYGECHVEGIHVCHEALIDALNEMINTYANDTWLCNTATDFQTLIRHSQSYLEWNRHVA